MVNRSTLIRYCFILVGILAILVLADNFNFVVSNAALITPVPGANLSTNLTLNVTSHWRINASSGTEIGGNLTNVTVQFLNASNVSQLVWNITLTDKDVTSNQTFNYTADSGVASLLPDGAYNITLNSTNATDDVLLINRTVFKTKSDMVVVDNTAPFVIFSTDGSSTGSNSTIDRRNYTTNQLIVFNVTVLNGSTSTSGWNNVTDTISVTFNVSNRSMGGLDTVLIASSPNSSVFNVSINQTQLRDGNYTVTVWANDTVQNVNNSVNISFIVDTTPPDLVELITVEGANVSDYLQFQVNDSLSEVLSCDLYINNTLNSTRLNVTNGTTYNFTLRSTIVNGEYNWSVLCNDSVLIQNTSILGNFTFDSTSPTATVTCSPSSVEVDQAVACSCLGTDLLSPLTSTVFTDTSPSTSVTGSKTTGTCTVTDQAGNTGTATGSYTVTASSGSGGGSGGSGGGSSSGVASQFENRVWTSINAGEKATLTTKNGGIGVTDVSFVVDKTVYGAWLKVKLADTLPTTVPAYGKKVYKTVQITENNVESALTGNAVINFKVLKSWLTSSNLDKSGVALLHYVDNKWAELPTTVGQDDGTYVHYTAETPSFSYFVIGEKSGAAPAPVVEKAPTPTETPTDVTQPSTEEPVAAEASSSSTAVWVVVGIVLVALLAWVVLSMKKRR